MGCCTMAMNMAMLCVLCACRMVVNCLSLQSNSLTSVIFGGTKFYGTLYCFMALLNVHLKWKSVNAVINVKICWNYTNLQKSRNVEYEICGTFIELTHSWFYTKSNLKEIIDLERKALRSIVCNACKRMPFAISQSAYHVLQTTNGNDLNWEFITIPEWQINFNFNFWKNYSK